MSLDAIGIIAEIVAAIAVVISLIYLAVQVRDSSNQSAAATSSNLMNEFNRLQEIFLTSPDIPRLFDKLETDGELEGTELVLLEIIGRRYLVLWWEVQTAYDRKLLDESVYTTFSQDVERIANQYPLLAQKMKTSMDTYTLASRMDILKPLYRGQHGQ